MRSVILKDVILNRNAMLANLAVFVAFLVYAAWDRASPSVYAVFSGLMFSFLPIAIVTREDKYKALVLGCSLPVTRRTIVQARYVLTFGFAVTGILFALTLGATLPVSNLRAEALFSPGPVLTGLAVVTVISSVLLPFTLRFGSFGLIVMLVVLQVAGILLLTVTRLTRSSADKRVLTAAVGAARALSDRIGGPAFTALVVAGLILLLLLSFAVSLRVFERREL
jgi:ABC-2 type transport system permease protein